MVDAGERAQPRQQLRQQRRVQGAPAAASTLALTHLSYRQQNFANSYGVTDALPQYCRKVTPGRPCSFLPPPPPPPLYDAHCSRRLRMTVHGAHPFWYKLLNFLPNVLLFF